MSWNSAARAEEPDHANDVLEEIRQEISANDNDLKEARERRDVVLKAAASFAGALRTFKSGSLAHGNVNNPVNDADGGIVLDRRTYVDLGPTATRTGARRRSLMMYGSTSWASCARPTRARAVG